MYSKCLSFVYHVNIGIHVPTHRRANSRPQCFIIQQGGYLSLQNLQYPSNSGWNHSAVPSSSYYLLQIHLHNCCQVFSTLTESPFGVSGRVFETHSPKDDAVE